MSSIAFRDFEILTKTVWGEARGEPRLGKHAVAWTVINRWRSGRWFGKETLADTCLIPWQYTCWKDAQRPRLEALTLDKPSAQSCAQAILDVLFGAAVDPTAGATHYYVEGTPMPTWAKDKEPVRKIGHHLFFGDVS